MARRRATTPVTAALLRGWPLPQPDGRDGKEERGRVLVIGGSDEIPGGVMLAAIAALRAGAGKLQIATAARVATAVAVAVPEARVVALRTGRGGELARGAARAVMKEIVRSDAVLIGPGMMSAPAGADLLRTCARADRAGTLVIDSAPLCSLRAHGRVPGTAVITPHAGEMARLWGIERRDVERRPTALAREAAAELGVVVALKGAVTVVAAPDGTTFENVAGNPGLGTSGSGDALSGVIAGLCARGADPLQAAVWGVHLHARAGEVLAARVGPLGFLARELLREIPPLMAAFGRPRRR